MQRIWNVLLCALFAIVALRLCSSPCFAQGYHYSVSIGGPVQGQLSYPTGVAVDPSGNVVVADSGNHQIQVFDSHGNFLRKFGANGTGDGQLQFPGKVAVDPSGKIIVLDSGVIKVFDSQGNYLRKIGKNINSMLGPVDVAAGPTGNIYVASTGSQSAGGGAVSTGYSIIIYDCCGERSRQHYRG